LIGLQQKISLGALVLGLGRRTAPLPRRLLRKSDTQENANKGTVVGAEALTQGIGLVEYVHGADQLT
jgi:hypothetical protein